MTSLRKVTWRARKDSRFSTYVVAEGSAVLIDLFRLGNLLISPHPEKLEISVMMIIVEVVVVILVVDIDAFRQPELYVVLLKRYRSVINRKMLPH